MPDQWTRYKLENVDSLFIGSHDEHEIEVVCPNKNDRKSFSIYWKETWDESEEIGSESWLDEVQVHEKGSVLMRVLGVFRRLAFMIAFVLALTPPILKSKFCFIEKMQLTLFDSV